MNNILKRGLSGVLATLLVGQVMIYGDGASQGIAHAETIQQIKSDLQIEKKKEQLSQEFDLLAQNLGNVEYFDVGDKSDSNENNDSSWFDVVNSDEEFSFSSHSINNNLRVASYGIEEQESVFPQSLTVEGFIQKGIVDGYDTYDNTPIYIRIFNGNWEEIAYQEIYDGEGYFLTASGSDVYHVKFECDGYLPFYLKDFGTGHYITGSGDSDNTITLIPGDTTYNYYNDNQWSDDVLNSEDSSYVKNYLGTTAYGNTDFNFSMDLNDDGIIDQSELDEFCLLYSSLGEGQYYDVAGYNWYDVNDDGVINYYDYILLENMVYGSESSEIVNIPDFTGDNIFSAEDLEPYLNYLYSADEIWLYNHDMNFDGIVDKNDYIPESLNYYASLTGINENYHSYMDKNSDYVIDDYDVNWFEAAYSQYGDLNWDNAFKRTITACDNGYFPYSLNMHDTNFDLNGCAVYVADCMSFTTDMPQFWSDGHGATLNINGGYLEIANNLVFRTASPDGWNGNAGQLLDMNGGTLIIGKHFDFGQANCYDIIRMNDEYDWLEIYGNWNYITMADMEGEWTAGQINFLGPVWQVNEASGTKSIFSSETHSILFYYSAGKQTILWDNCETYIDNEDGSLNTLRTFNFGYEYGLIFPEGYTEERYWFRPWFRPYDEPDYTLYRRGWEMGDGIHIATGNYTKSFADMSTMAPGMTIDFVRTYNSTSTEEGSFGIGWDFNIDVSKILNPASGYYQVVLPDGSNSTFKEVNGEFECQNNHNQMKTDNGGYVITLPSQIKYYFNADKELYKIEDTDKNTIEISGIENNVRTVTDSIGNEYYITYTSSDEHKRVTEIKDVRADRTVKYFYNSNNQLISAASISGGTEKYTYDENGHMNSITNAYDEITEQIVYYADGRVDNISNSSGLKQVYQYDKTNKQTGIKEYDNGNFVKSTKYDYDEKYAVKTNTVYTDGQTYELEKATYSKDSDGVNKYDEVIEYIDDKGNITKTEYDKNGNITKTILPDGSESFAIYDNINNQIVSGDANNNITINEYEGKRIIRSAQTLNPVSDTNVFYADGFNPKQYINDNVSNLAITEYDYYADGEKSRINGLIRKITDPEGNVTGYDYNYDGTVKKVVNYNISDNIDISEIDKIDGVCYEYNELYLASKTVTAEGFVTEVEYDKTGNVTNTYVFGKSSGSTPAVMKIEYDLLGRKIKEVAPNYAESNDKYTSYTYYASDLLKEKIDSEGNTVLYEYNAYGNPVKTVNPDGSQNLTVYDGLGREIKTYFKSSENSDSLILTSTSYEISDYNFSIFNSVNSSPSSVSYNALKTTKIQYVTENKNITTEIITDCNGNTVEESVNGKLKRKNTYYSNGQLGSQTYDPKNENNGEHTTKYTYNYLNMLTETYTPFNLKDGSVNYSVSKNTYYKNGKEKTIETNSQCQDASDEKWNKTEFWYDCNGNLIQTAVYSDDCDDTYTKYFYDKDNIKTKMFTGMTSVDDENKNLST